MKKTKYSEDRGKLIFNRIAGIYDLFDGPSRKGYKSSIRKLVREIDFKRKTVLDIGTGTGVWADIIREEGAIVSGVDFSEKMLEKARKRYGKEIHFSLADAKNLKNFEENSFDIVTACFVLHGMKRERREPILLEMNRVSKDIVAIYDYDKNASFFFLFLEWLEKSDYHNFTEHFFNEFSDIFTNCKKIPANKGSAFYIGHKKYNPYEPE